MYCMVCVHNVLYGVCTYLITYVNVRPGQADIVSSSHQSMMSYGSGQVSAYDAVTFNVSITTVCVCLLYS